MRINFNDIQNMIIKPQSSVSILIMDYGAIVQKLENKEQQSWYFKQSIQSALDKKDEIKNKFEKISLIFNKTSLDDFIAQKAEIEKKQQEVLKPRMNMIKRIVYAAYVSKINSLNELIVLKSKIEKLQPIDYYLENPEAFLKIAE